MYVCLGTGLIPLDKNALVFNMIALTNTLTSSRSSLTEAKPWLSLGLLTEMEVLGEGDFDERWDPVRLGAPLNASA